MRFLLGGFCLIVTCFGLVYLFVGWLYLICLFLQVCYLTIVVLMVGLDWLFYVCLDCFVLELTVLKLSDVFIWLVFYLVVSWVCGWIVCLLLDLFGFEFGWVCFNCLRGLLLVVFGYALCV